MIPVQMIRGYIQQDGYLRPEFFYGLKLETANLSNNPVCNITCEYIITERGAYISPCKNPVASCPQDFTYKCRRCRFAVGPCNCNNRRVNKAACKLDLTDYSYAAGLCHCQRFNFFWNTGT